MPANECIPFYRPGADITGEATAAVTGKRCLAISGDAPADGGISVAHAAAAGRIVGVAVHDAAVGAKVPVILGPGHVVPITTSAIVAAFAEVEVGANGTVIPVDRVARPNSVAIGYALTGAANGADAKIKLY